MNNEYSYQVKSNGFRSEFGASSQNEEEEVRRARANLRIPQRFPPAFPGPGKRPPRRIPRRPRMAQSVNYGNAVFDQPQPGGSEYVRWVQTMLNQILNLQLPVDGIMNVQTRSAIRSFQEKNSLPVTGIVGPDTERALMAVGSGQSPTSSPANPDEPAPTAEPAPAAEFEWETEVDRKSRDYIKWVQQSLNQIMGLRLAVDGNLGPRTRSAIRSFQEKNGLSPDGVVGERTEAALKAASLPGTTTIPAVSQNIVLGLDTASVAENKNPNWLKAKTDAAISFAIIRSNWGTWQDSVFKRDWPLIKNAGIVRGAYLFLRFPHPKYNMQAPDPVSQAKKLITVVGQLDKSDLPPTLDVEFPGGRAITGLTAQQCLERVRTAWKVLKDYYGVAPIIYTSARVWKEDLNNLPAPDLAQSPLWLARYPFSKGPAVYDSRVSRLNSPPVPPPWGDSTNWWIHQYQGDALRLPGFPTGNVDLNRFNTMVKGASGDQVKWVQRRLGIPRTGLFDAAMESILRAFQNRNGIIVNGTVDVQTFAYLCWSNS
jgi:peptidoglycan hydrolase-like protein with peptidoglycan-binding domain